MITSHESHSITNHRQCEYLLHSLSKLITISNKAKLFWLFAVRVHEWLVALRWRNNRRDSVSIQQPYDCLLNRLFRRRWKKTSKLRVTGLCAWNSPETGEFHAQMASNAEHVSIWWRHHGYPSRRANNAKKLQYHGSVMKSKIWWRWD